MNYNAGEPVQADEPIQINDQPNTPESLENTPVQPNPIDELRSPTMSEVEKAIDNLMPLTPINDELPLLGDEEGLFFTAVNTGDFDYAEIKDLAKIPMDHNDGKDKLWWQNMLDNNILHLSNYCGPGGRGQSLHPIDDICKKHDMRYKALKRQGVSEYDLQNKWNEADEKMAQDLNARMRTAPYTRDFKEFLSIIGSRLYLGGKPVIGFFKETVDMIKFSYDVDRINKRNTLL